MLYLVTLLVQLSSTDLVGYVHQQRQQIVRVTCETTLYLTKKYRYHIPSGIEDAVLHKALRDRCGVIEGPDDLLLVP